MSASSVGRFGEELAAAWLQHLGWKILRQNVRICGVQVDILANSPSGELVIVEVKMRSRLDKDDWELSLTPKQLQRLGRAGYTLQSKHSEQQVRIDLIEVDQNCVYQITRQTPYPL